MEPFTRVTGIAAPLPRINVDTDQIMPREWCISITKTGFGKGLFGHWRYRPDGSDNPDFVLNKPAYRGAVILVAGANYGCGSSREAAVWGHREFGIRAIVAPSFAAIFQDNCFNNGMLPATLPEATVESLMVRLAARPGAEMTVDLAAQMIAGPDGDAHAFTVDGARRTALLEGLDDIGQTLRQRDAIAAFQAGDRARRPWAWLRA